MKEPAGILEKTETTETVCRKRQKQKHKFSNFYFTLFIRWTLTENQRRLKVATDYMR